MQSRWKNFDYIWRSDYKKEGRFKHEEWITFRKKLSVLNVQIFIQSKFRQSFLLFSLRVGFKWKHKGSLTNGSFWFFPLGMSLWKMWHTVSHIRGEMVVHRASGKLSAEDLKEQQVMLESIVGSSDQCLEFMQNSAYTVIFSAIICIYMIH